MPRRQPQLRLSLLGGQREEWRGVAYERARTRREVRHRSQTGHHPKPERPPLRPNVVDLLVNQFPNLEFVANGGVSSMAAVRERIYNRPTHGGFIGAMVGRAAINDPCSFATADSLWNNTAPTTTNNPN